MRSSTASDYSQASEEGRSLLGVVVKEEPATLDDEIAERRLGIFFWILVIVGFSGFVAFFGWDREVVQIITRYFASRESTTTTDLYLKATNEYGSFSAPYPWLEDVSGSQIVEPYKSTVLSLSGAYASGSTFSWSLDYPSEDEPTQWTGSNAQAAVTINEPGAYAITVEAFDSKTGSFRGRYTTLLVCRYVRREIRDLTSTDRARFFQAAAFLWNTTTAEGASPCFALLCSALLCFAALPLTPTLIPDADSSLPPCLPPPCLSPSLPPPRPSDLRPRLHLCGNPR